MGNAWRNITKTFLSYQRSDRNAIVILSTLIFLVIIANVVLNYIPSNSKADFSEIKAILDEWKKGKEEKQSYLVLFDFNPNTISEVSLDSLAIPKYVKRNLLNYRKAGGQYKTHADVRKIYGMNDSIFALIEDHIQIKVKKEKVATPKRNERGALKGFFDPNNCSVSELKTYGFNNYQANNLLAYRNKGGAFRLSTDILKIYGIDTAFYNKIAKHIKIKNIEAEEKPISEKTASLELNSADSTQLMRLNGIGPAYARRILKYRNLLGGFCSKEQLIEVYNFPEETYLKIKDNISVDTSSVVKLRINFTEFSELLKHPYLNKEQVQTLMRKRETDGSFKKIEELELLEGFDSELIMKIRPYITCR